jgi:BirA family biotin operon repressor/biotin-[acetyl-CoA-carboxylase] ligase
LLGDPSQDERVRVKWPNDVWIDQRKVAGVLCESHVRGSTLAAAVIGFGVNVSTREFPEELAGKATSLSLSGAPVAREELLVEILAGLAARSQVLEQDGASSLTAELSRHDALFGRRVRVEGVEGVAAGFDHSGGLLLRLSQDEKVVTLSAGSVEVVG